MHGTGGEGNDVRAVSLVSPSVSVFSQGSLGNFMFRKKGLREEDALKQTQSFRKWVLYWAEVRIICSVVPSQAVSA